MVTHYPYLLHDQGRQVVVLWYGDETDGVVTTGDRRVRTFDDVDGARRFAEANGLPLADERPSRLDLDAVATWMRRGRTVPCALLLEGWNFLADVARSVRAEADHGEAAFGVYAKLFAGNNLPAVNPPGEYYVPVWSAEELRLLRRVLGDGLRVWREHRPEPR
jgi:hypothetical protein